MKSKSIGVNRETIKSYKFWREEYKKKPLTIFLNKAFPKMTIKQGCAVWWLLQNRELIVKRKDIAGSFRYNASCIAEAVGKGTYYLTFYCAEADEYLNEDWKKNMRKELRFNIKYALSLIPQIGKAGGELKDTEFSSKLT